MTVWDAPRLVYEYNGPNAHDGWTIFDADDQRVATVDTPGFFSLANITYTMLDTAGQPVLMVTYVNPGIIARSGVPLVVVHPSGNEWGRFEPPSLNGYSETVFDALVGTTTVGQLTASHDRSAITDAGLADAAGTRVATIGQGKKRMGFFKQQAWLTLERPPDLADPLRLLAVAAPLALHLDLSRRGTSSRRGRSTWHPL